MKRFFAKATMPFAINTEIANNSRKKNSKHESNSKHVKGSTTSHPAGLHPKYVLPAVPHPCPHDHLAILATTEGLLIQPYVPGQSRKTLNTRSTSCLKISWRAAEVVELHPHSNHAGASSSSNEDPDWEEAVIVYGIVGMLELFSCSYLLVISSRGEVGNVIDHSHTIYSVNGVTAIPLVEDRARSAVTALASRNAALSRPSLLPRATSESILSPDGSIFASNEDTAINLSQASSPRVQFSANDDIRMMTPKLTSVSTIEDRVDPRAIARPASAQSSYSDISTSSSEGSIATSPVFKTLASRLSFWSRLSKRPASAASTPADFEFPLMDVVQPTTLAEERETLDKLMQQQEEPAKVVEAIVNAMAPSPSTNEERHRELEEKVVRECIRELTKGEMYFAYNFDITRSLQHKQEQIAKSKKQHDLLEGLGALPSSEPELHSPYPKDGDRVSVLAEPNLALPLWRRVDKQFWWNECMAKPFIDAGVHPYVLPIMQGYFQAAVLNIPVLEHAGPHIEGDPGEVEYIPADYIIISRRSRYRAGLRYQRRGIDEEAHVANFVETETIMRIERERQQNVFSHVQIRGSIPLFWTQSGYSLKPPPVLASDRTHAQNLDAIKRHFKRTVPLYGPHTIINLAEQGGREGVITQKYREYVAEFNDSDVQYCEYDFHRETKGMKYENISKLVSSMEKVFATQGYLWISDDTALSHQNGVFRVNCIDCLDRTNVVQSAFARYVLSQQLSAVALLSSSVAPGSETDLIINDVWANNGDAISRAYAGTSALKGDFTRTGKRDLSGMLNDGMNSLARIYTSTFSDWFCQAAIDFMLGYRTKAVFSEFLLRLQSTDPRDLIRLSKIRAEAVATCASRVLPEGEHLRSGWTLFAPEEVNVKIGLKFEEKVLLLSSKALYIVSYDYSLEKVKLYIRVPLGDVVGITKGAYILSPLEEASRDPEQNHGFVIAWLTTREESRVTSYSVRNNVSPVPGSGSTPLSPSGAPLGAFMSGTRSPTLVTRSLGRNSLPPISASINAGLKSLVSAKVAATSGKLPQMPSTGSAEKSFAAFKVLPVDPARIRRASSSVTAYSEMSDEMQGASTCKEAADMIVETIYRACEDAGGASGTFVDVQDIVSLAEAQRMTSVYAKMEYGVKRLLWLGG